MQVSMETFNKIKEKVLKRNKRVKINGTPLHNRKICYIVDKELLKELPFYAYNKDPLIYNPEFNSSFWYVAKHQLIEHQTNKDTEE